MTESNNSSSNGRKIIIGILLIILCCILYFLNIESPNKKRIPNSTSFETNLETLPVVIYTQEIGVTDDDERAWPSIQILRKIGNSKPEILANVGKSGEYPDSFKLIQGNKFLLINLESKLQILNLETKELADLFLPKRQVFSMTISPNEDKLFIWDQKYASKDYIDDYYIHILNIADGKSQIIKQGTSPDTFLGYIWRKDNKIILMKLFGDSSKPWYFDLSNNKILETPGDFMFLGGVTSKDGTAMAVLKQSVPDACEAYSGSAPSVFDVIEPISGKILGTIGGSGKIVRPKSFSPDGNEIVYETLEPGVKYEECEKNFEQKYYKTIISTNQTEEISNINDTLKAWDKDYVNAIQTYNEKSGMWSILFEGKEIVTSDKPLKVIGQFYSN